MDQFSFSPQGEPAQSSVGGVDVVATTLARIARIFLIGALGVMPILFIPVQYAPLGFSKVLFVVLGITLALVFYSLSVLRSGTLKLRPSLGILAIWVLALVGFLSAALSGDFHDSFFGDSFGIHTTVFIALMALVITAVSILGEHKGNIMHLYMTLTAVGLLVGAYHVLRFVFGASFLSFGIFTDAAATPFGGWNDLALFFGLTLLLALVAVEQFPLTKWGKVFFGATVGVALLILAVVNFTAIWVVLGLVSLIVLMYALTKNRFKNALTQPEADSSNTIVTIVLSVAVFICAIVFVAGGPSIGQLINSFTGISYVEVRPSFEATFDIARSVYGENAFLGTGPNKFIDAWRQYKDPAINQTIFWDTPFEGGVGYIPTFAVTTGILGVLAWLFFLAMILRAGVRLFFSGGAQTDKFWYFVGVSSFVSALYIWGMSIIYVPGVAILILAALFTGLLFAAESELRRQKEISISVGVNKSHGFILVACSIIVIVFSVGVLYTTGRQYSGLLSFNQAVLEAQRGASIDLVEEKISSAYEISRNDRFAREILGIELGKMNQLIALQNPTDEERQRFQTVVANAVNAGQLAVDADDTEPRNWQSLGAVYSLLAGAGVEGAADRAREAYANAKKYNPANPEITLQMAQLESRVGDLERAVELAREAIGLKSNYTDAYLFLSQVEVARGDITGAIESTRASITLEPNNAGRYYQLGVLYLSNNEVQSAISAFERAVTIDSNFANALYFLALAYDNVGRSDEARARLERVLELNPGNTEVTTLLDQLGRGESIGAGIGIPSQGVPEVTPTVSDEGEVVSSEDPDSPLLSPLNPVPSSEDAESESNPDEDSDEDSENAGDEDNITDTNTDTPDTTDADATPTETGSVTE